MLTAFVLFKQKVLILFLDFFIGQRSLNLTLDQIEQVHADGIAFMEAAKAVFHAEMGHGTLMELQLAGMCGNSIQVNTKLWIFNFTDGQKTWVLKVVKVPTR